MVKICQTGLLKLNFEISNFLVLAKNFRRPWMKFKFFFATFQILGPLGCQGWVVIPQNVKKVKITAPYCTSSCTVVVLRPIQRKKAHSNPKRHVG
jgi:hypothetical protein